MRATTDFTPIAPDEEIDLSINFSSYLASGDSAATVEAWLCTVADNSPVVDPSPSSRLSGPPSLANNILVQTVNGCVNGVTYVMEGLVNTTLGERLSIWAYLQCTKPGVG